MEISEVRKAIQDIEALEKEIINYNRLNGVIFTIEEDDIADLKTRITTMLENYIVYLSGASMDHLWDDTIQASPSLVVKGEHAPAYRKDIDTEEIYKLYQQGISIRGIGRQMGCSADTVKRRIEKKERESNGE